MEAISNKPDEQLCTSKDVIHISGKKVMTYTLQSDFRCDFQWIYSCHDP